MNYVTTAITAQAIGTGLVAFFFWQLGRAIQVQFVKSWAMSATCLSVSLGFLYLTFRFSPFDSISSILFSHYLVGCYLAVFFFWSGLREYTWGQPFGWRESWRIVPFALIGLFALWLSDGFLQVMPYHFLLLGILFACSLPSTVFSNPPLRPSVGMPIVQVGIFALVCILCTHSYLISRQILSYGSQEKSLWNTAVYDVLAELLIALGIVILACERIRDQLQATNMELSRAKAELEKTARTDALTGLLNRHAFEESLESYRDTALKGCVAVIDLNDLKQLNDRYLHSVGDAALRLLARALSSKFRVSDPIYRIGGDEFLVLMPLGNEEELRQRLASIDDTLLNQRLPGLPEPRTLVIAWGIASFEHGGGIHSAYQKADQAMYVQKHLRKIRPANLPEESRTRANSISESA